MLTVYDAADGVLITRERPAAINDGTVWIDLLNPTKDEDLLVEQALGIAVPTREEMAEIEASSRLYQEGGAHYMTAVVLYPAGRSATSRSRPRRSPSSWRATASSPCATPSRAASRSSSPACRRGTRPA